MRPVGILDRMPVVFFRVSGPNNGVSKAKLLIDQADVDGEP